MDKYNKIVKISPFISTANIGDYIIAEYCDLVFKELFGNYLGVVVPLREKLSKSGSCAILTSKFSFVCGTNLLSSNIRKNKQWRISRYFTLKATLDTISKKKWYNIDLVKTKMSNIHIILLGVGWFDYQDSSTRYTKEVLKTILDKSYLHSVRDSYTQKKLNEIGIDNVLNTACPTMWQLTPEFCKTIPTEKSKTVVSTITDYRKSPKRDKLFLDILLSSYETVYLWLQSFEDVQYLKDLGYFDKVKLIPPTLAAYDEFLENNSTDYVGTRLHGGIRALNHKKRSCIIGIDNRALEIAADTQLPIVKVNNIESDLKQWIYSQQSTLINLPLENIKKWKSQFIVGDYDG